MLSKSRPSTSPLLPDINAAAPPMCAREKGEREREIEEVTNDGREGLPFCRCNRQPGDGGVVTSRSADPSVSGRGSSGWNQSRLKRFSSFF